VALAGSAGGVGIVSAAPMTDPMRAASARIERCAEALDVAVARFERAVTPHEAEHWAREIRQRRANLRHARAWREHIEQEMLHDTRTPLVVALDIIEEWWLLAIVSATVCVMVVFLFWVSMAMFR